MKQLEITRLEKSGGPLTKRLHLDEAGVLRNDSSNCRMSRGKMHRERLVDLEAFAALIENMARNEAVALGSLKEGLPDSVSLVTKQDPRASEAGYATRTKDKIAYREGEPGIVLIDYDTKGMPASVKERVAELGGFFAALVSICSMLPNAGLVIRGSTSSNVINMITGDPVPGGDGKHLFVSIADGSDAKRFLDEFHNKCWLHGLGWYLVDSVGKLQEKSIIDRSVAGAERLVFEAAPDLDAPLRQERREPLVKAGPPLDTREACASLSAAENASLKRLKDKAVTPEMKAECTAKHKVPVENRIRSAVASGMSEPEAKKMVEKLFAGILHPAVVLQFADKEIGSVSVADALKDPSKYDGLKLGDPIGTDYHDPDCATLYANSQRRDHSSDGSIPVGPEDGVARIHSHAHGGGTYELRWDAASIEAAVRDVDKRDVGELFVRLVLGADLTPVEVKSLEKVTGEVSGAGYQVIHGMLKDARKELERAAKAKRRQAAQAKRAAEAGENGFYSDPEVALEWMNERHFVITIEGATAVGSMEKDAFEHEKMVLAKVNDFQIRYGNGSVTIETGGGKNGDEPADIPLPRYWLNHPDRREYKGIDIVVPDQGEAILRDLPNGKLNLWVGYGRDREKGKGRSWTLLKAHILNVLAAGIEVRFEYIINWFAWVLQHPTEMAEVILAFRGGKGTGKGTVLTAVMKCFGAHGTRIHDPEHLTGRFNAHLRGLLLSLHR